jgi:glycosyltransferase involved in cell wall biosynthesis
MNVFAWHVHGSWMTAFVQGRQRTFVPVLPERGPFGRGRARTWAWPDSVVEVAPEEARDLDFDVIVLQRPEELELASLWLGRRPGIDVPALYVEHNAPQGAVNEMRHPIANRPELVLVHVTHFNRLFWDAGSTRSVVIEHGIVDPGARYTGELARAAVVVNEPLRRARVTGTDLLPRFAKHAPLDLFGMESEPLGGVALAQAELHDELARRRLYLHPFRWTSLGLSLLEAMQLGMPVVALATTEVAAAVPPAAGVVTNELEALEAAITRLLADPDEARARGREARRFARERYGLERFLADWERLFAEVVA